MVEKKDSDAQNNSISLLRQTNPNLVRLMNERIESMDPSEEDLQRMEQKMRVLVHQRKEKLAKDGKLNNFDKLKWLEPIITPIKQFERWFRLQGFPMVDFRVAVIAMILVVIGVGSYYFVYKNNEKPILISKNTTPNGLDTPITPGERGYNRASLKEIRSIYIEAKEDQEELSKLVSLVFKKLNDDNSLESALSIVSEKKFDHDAVLRISVNPNTVSVEILNIKKIPNVSIGFKSYKLTDLDTLSSTISKDFMAAYDSK